jgi:hypothetical protein
MYLRLVTTQEDADSRQGAGVFQIAYDLYERGDLGHDEIVALKAVLLWFEKHLPTPDRAKLDARAIFWFKAQAVEAARRVWDLAEVVKRHGVEAEVVKTSRPGYIVYEDDLQVAAIPFRDTFRMGSGRNA